MKLISIKEYAAKLGVTPQAITKRIRNGSKLKGISKIHHIHIRCILLQPNKDF
jgi:hypothetical protein